MNLDEYYAKVEAGISCEKLILPYIASYRRLVMWGASHLGTRLGEYLISKGVTIDTYWDARADEIKTCNGIPVIETFDNDTTPPKDTLVILCIGNTAIHNSLMRQLQEHGFTHVLLGDRFFMDVICPFSVETGIDGKICNGTMTCRSMFCKKLHNIIRQQNDNGGVFLPNLTFMVTTYCSLKCKYCVAYMNSYDDEHRMHVSYDQIADDIDRIFDAVDAVGSVTIQGGEPFLHPDIDRIVEKMLEKKNLGIVSVATNGIFRIAKEKMAPFKDSRLNVAFSGYYDALPQDMLDIYYGNIGLMEELDVPHTIGVRMPEWTIPPTLWNRGYSTEHMAHKKQMCKLPERCMQVMNGRLYPCLYSVSLHGTGVADYPEDHIPLIDDHLAERIQRFMDLPFYYSCGHCGGGGGTTGMAGEQGFFDFVTSEENEHV